MTTESTQKVGFEEVWRTIQELALQTKETERVLKESSLDVDRRFRETDRKLKEVTKQLGEHGNRLGEFVQEMVKPAVVRLFQERNLPVHQVMPNIRAFDDNRQLRSEIDLLVINSDVAIAVECKSQLKQQDVDEHLERLEIFKDCFPQFKNFTILGAVAAMVLPEEVGRNAYRRGLFVLAQSGDTMEIRNDAKFEPGQW
jgi:hypothetical protein